MPKKIALQFLEYKPISKKKNMRTLLLFLCLLLSALLTAQVESRPDYDEVVHHYFQRYSHPYWYGEIVISRRPQGYFVAKQLNLKTDTAELLYDFKNQSYRELSDAFRWPDSSYIPPDRPTADTLRAVEEFLAGTQDVRNELKQVPYYGYPGWYKDVIALCEEAERPLTAWEWNALGRAYFNYSTALLGFGPYPDSTDSFELPPGRGRLSEAQINRYLEIIEKELAAYGQLVALAPDFLTDIGPATRKYALHVTHAFVTLLYFQDEATARRVHLQNLYDPYLLQMARNLLNSCPPHAILLTWGDVDTYPLYYLQATEGLRTDVILVNQSLSRSSRYQQMLLGGPFGARPLRTLLPPRFFEKIAVCVVSQVDQPGEALPADTLFAILADTLNYRISPYSPNQYEVGIPTTTIRLKAPPDIYVPGGNRADAITYATNTPYLTPELVFWLDLLKANDWERPLCFTMGTFSGPNPPLVPYLVWEGMILRLYPQVPEEERPDPLLLPINVDRSFQLWMEAYDSDTSVSVIPHDKAPLHQQALVAGFRLLFELNAQNDPDRAQAIGHRLMQLFPNEQAPWDERWLLIARELGVAGDEDAAELISRTILKD
ncbi:MAG: hypothetical protein KDC34_08570 [Saprospiraceae bacterium]|nr:hypothetical protein [Saprospiraceae bacterium]